MQHDILYNRNPLTNSMIRESFYGYEGQSLKVWHGGGRISCQILKEYEDYILCERTTPFGNKYKICVQKIDLYQMFYQSM